MNNSNLILLKNKSIFKIKNLNVFNLFACDLFVFLLFIKVLNFNFINLKIFISISDKLNKSKSLVFSKFYFKKYKQLSTNLNFKDFKNLKKNEYKFNFVKNVSILKKNNYLFLSGFIKIFLLFNASFFDKSFNAHHIFSFYYMKSNAGHMSSVDASRFFNIWKKGYILLFNLFYHDATTLTFSTPTFKNETLGLNWNSFSLDHLTWKHCFPFFYSKITNFNVKIDFFYKKLKDYNFNYFILTDCTYHFKNLYYLNRHNFYTIGVVTGNLNPWLVSFHLPVMINTHLAQFFFFKFLILVKRYVEKYKFIFLNKTWNNFLILSKITQIN